MKRLTFLIASLALAVSCADSTVTISPDGALSSIVNNESGKLTVAMSYDNRPIMNATPLRLTINGECVEWQITGATSETKSDKLELPAGEFYEKVIDFTESEYKLTGETKSGEDISGSLFVRSYDKVMAYRFVLNKAGEYTIVEDSPYLFTDNDGGYMSPNAEYEPLGPDSPVEIGNGSLYAPVIYNSNSGYYLALHESDLHNYPQLRLTEDKANNAVKINNLEAVVKGEVALPWRTIMYGESIAEIHNNKATLLTFNKPAEGDFSWVKPGVSLWEFRTRGMTYDGFTYDYNVETFKRFIDFAAEKGLEYLMIDSSWYYSDPLNHLPQTNIHEVISHANSKNIGLVIYYDLKYLTRGGTKVDFDTVARTYAEWGIKGIKYGFLGNAGEIYNAQEKARITEEVVATAAKYKLLIDFHDGPIPFSGLQRTYPNYITREYCHAQLDRRTAFYPRAFVKTICTNLLAGAIDQTNGTFSIYGMEHRLKGPGNPYYSTVASEAARVFMSHTGHLTMLIDPPGSYNAKSDLFEFIADLPARWDEAKYLDMEFDSHVSIARRGGDDWFAATVYNEAGGDSEMKLCFLDPARKYKATIYRDAADTHYVTNPESYEIESREVTSKDTLKVKVAPGGGFGVSFKAI